MPEFDLFLAAGRRAARVSLQCDNKTASEVALLVVGKQRCCVSAVVTSEPNGSWDVVLIGPRDHLVSIMQRIQRTQALTASSLASVPNDTDYH